MLSFKNGVRGPQKAIPTKSKRTPAFNSSCNDSDGAKFCDCQYPQRGGARAPAEKCMNFGRPITPLAFRLHQEPVNPQEACPLFSRIPAEMRNMIFEYSLGDCTSYPFSSEHRFNPSPLGGKAVVPPTDIALNLLLTCRAVYLEAYQKPFLLNPLIVYNWGNLPSYDIVQPKYVALAPWQFALIQGLDISLQQTSLEGEILANYLSAWRARERHDGCVVAPRFYQESRKRYPGALIQSFNFVLMPNTGDLRDGDNLTLGHKGMFYQGGWENGWLSHGISEAQVMRARPLTHLTLRLSRKDWWTWDNHHSSTSGDMRLGLDPACGDGSAGILKRPTADRMCELAEQRRQSYPPKYSGTWGAVVGQLPDLKTLTLVLSTFGRKKAQLDTVVESAKTWQFPIADGEWNLAWDGKVENCSYECDEEDRNLESELEDLIEESPWKPMDRHVEVRVVRFSRDKGMHKRPVFFS